MKKIIVLLMLIISVKGSGQVLQKPAVYGYEFRRLAVDTLFAVPADTFSVPAALQSFPFIARKGTSFYFWNTSTHVWAAFSAAGATPTWQQVLTAGSTLTTNNTISLGDNSLIFSGNASTSSIEATIGQFSIDASTGAASTSTFAMAGGAISIKPHLGNLIIDTLTNLSTQNTLLGWKQGSSQGQVGYVTLGTGLSLSSGVLSSSGGTPGGSDTYIQFNDGGSFGGDAGFTYNKTTNIFSTNNGAYRPTGTISFSDAGAGSVYRSSSDGLVFRAVTGSGYDLLMYDAVGNAVFGLEAGTSKLGSTSQIGAGLLGYGSWNAWMNLRGGTTTNASLTIRDGVAPTSPAEGQIWRTTDKVYNVIQTGAATKEFTLNDIALTSGRIPYTTTNGRLTDTATFLRSPGGNVGIGTSSPSASALLDVSSTTQGALMPRMTTTQRDAISSPATGLELFNTTTNTKQIYDGTRWVEAAHPLYKVYTALLSQSGSSDPTATVLENNLGGTVVWTRNSGGNYTATLSGAFTSGKTWTTINNIDPEDVGYWYFHRSDDNTLRFENTNGVDGFGSGVGSGGVPIEIRVYY